MVIDRCVALLIIISARHKPPLHTLRLKHAHMTAETVTSEGFAEGLFLFARICVFLTCIPSTALRLLWLHSMSETSLGSVQPLPQSHHGSHAFYQRYAGSIAPVSISTIF